MDNISVLNTTSSKVFGSLSKEDILDLKRQHGSPLLILDANLVREQYAKLLAYLPQVAHHYALKALAQEQVVEILLAESCGFEVASLGELNFLLKQAPHLSPSSIPFTHPVKSTADIEKAIKLGVKLFVFDNILELQKFAPYKDKVELMLRIAVDNNCSVVNLNKKFGCNIQLAFGLLNKAYEEGFKVSALAFHVGSQNLNPQPYSQALEYCKSLMQQLSVLGRNQITCIDIGGGFPAAYEGTLCHEQEYFASISQALEEFPFAVEFISEPGRFLVAPACLGVFSVDGRVEKDQKLWYYLDDGVYGCFSGQIYDHALYPLDYIKANQHEAKQKYVSGIFGPTCDSIDVVREEILLPELELGDTIVAKQMGAYSLASASSFNMVRPARLVVVNH